MDAIKIGMRIASLRTKRQMTQFQLAEKLEISDKAVSKWEVGGCYPDITMLPKIADLFGVSIDYLLRGAPVKRQHIKVDWLNPGRFNERVNKAYLDNGWKVVDMKLSGDGDGGGVVAVLMEKEIYDDQDFADGSADS